MPDIIAATEIAITAVARLQWQKSLSRAKRADLVALIADLIDENVARALASRAQLAGDIAGSLRQAHGAPENASQAAADTYDNIGRELMTGANVRRAYVALRGLAAQQEQLLLDPSQLTGLFDSAIRIRLHSNTLTQTLTALRAWTDHLDHVALRLEPAAGECRAALLLAGRFHDASIEVAGQLDTSRPADAEFVARHATSDRALPLEVLAATDEAE